MIKFDKEQYKTITMMITTNDETKQKKLMTIRGGGTSSFTSKLKQQNH
jgi:hypothetical protein